MKDDKTENKLLFVVNHVKLFNKYVKYDQT